MLVDVIIMTVWVCGMIVGMIIKKLQCRDWPRVLLADLRKIDEFVISCKLHIDCVREGKCQNMNQKTVKPCDSKGGTFVGSGCYQGRINIVWLYNELSIYFLGVMGRAFGS